MRRALGVGVIALLVLATLGGSFPREAAGAQAQAYPPHRYIYVPLYNYLYDLDNLPTGLVGFEILLIGYDQGFTYLEGPEIPSNWLDDPSLFAAVMSGMKRCDFAVHTNGLNIKYEEETFIIGGRRVQTLVYPPNTSDPDFDVDRCKLLGGFYLAREYAGINTPNILNDISTLIGWPSSGVGRYPYRYEVVFRKNFRPYKVLSYDPLEDDAARTLERAYVKAALEEIIANASETDDFCVDGRQERRYDLGVVPPYPSGNLPVNFWQAETGRIHKCSLALESSGQYARWLEPRLSRFPIRDPSIAICPNDPYIWYFPRILAPLHALMSVDNGEMCFDVDSIVELDAGQWWNPYGAQFIEVLQGPFAADDAKARAWVFLHVAMNNGHRLIDTVNPLDGEGNQIPQIIDVAAFDPLLFPLTFDGGPKIHGYHKRQISPSISELYKRFKYILSATGGTQAARMLFFRNNLASIISDVHINVMDPSSLTAKREIDVPELFQMIADRWSATNTYGLIPFAFLYTDLPEVDRGQGPPLVFEITCTFDTNPTLGGPYVPIRIIAEAHEGYYYTNAYGDPLAGFIEAILAGGLPFP